MQSGFDINELLEAAQTRWLKPAEVLFILQNHANYLITQVVPQKPPSGSLFLYNKRVLRFFRKDGYSWRKKKDGRTVGEAHEHLKVGNAEALNCYYAHGEENPTFQRRSYWMLDPAYEHIVLVHYREITEGRLSSGTVAELSPGTSSTFSQSPSACTMQKPESSGLSDIQSNQSHSSPGSIEVSSDATVGKGINCLSGSDVTGNLSTLSESEVSQALRRLEVQLSLDDDSLKDYGPVSDQVGNEDIYGVLDDQYDSRYAEVLSDSNGASQLKESGANEMHHHVTPGMAQSTGNGGSLIWNDVFELSKNSLNQEVEGILNANVTSPNGFFSLDKEQSSSGRLAEPQNHQLQDFAALYDGKWIEAAEDIDILANTSQTFSATPELSTMLLDPSFIMSFGKDSSLTVAKEQKFTIREISPEWGFVNDTTRVIIIGSFLCEPSESEWLCMFGDVVVPLQILQDGVFCCQAPPHPSGKVTLCITSGNRESCSEIREFEYRDKHSACVHCDKSEEETGRCTDEMLLLVRLVQMLLSNSPLQQEDNELEVNKLKSNVNMWNQIIEALLVGSATSVDTLDWLLQQLLMDKLQQWVSSRSTEGGQLKESSLSRKEQGIIHMIAGLGYEWALNPILGCGVGINFRDINGWTALHWAARFGREKMVAALIASGASALALTDPSSHDPTGRNAAYIAATNGYKGLAGYLSELALTSHLSSLTIEESELSKGSAGVEAELTVNSISKENVNSIEDQVSLRQTLAAVRNSAQAAARIQAAFRAHSFRKRQQIEAMTDLDEYGFNMNDIHGLSTASKLLFHNLRHRQKAALSIQKNYRGWKGRKDFQTLRQKVVKIQAHVRGYQIRKKYKAICWAVGILDRVVLRWRRKGAGLRGFRPEPNCPEEGEDEDDIIKIFRKEKVNVAIDEAVTRVLSMAESPEARQQYLRMLGRFQEAQAELQGRTSPGASDSQEGASNMENDDLLALFESSG